MEEDIFITDNLEVHKKDNFVAVSINPTLYSLEIIYSAAYTFIDRAYIIIDGDPKEEIIVQIRPKDNSADIENLGREFNNELINYSVYMHRTIKNQVIRETIVQRALNTNNFQPQASQYNRDSQENQISYIEDPDNIAKPWKAKE